MMYTIKDAAEILQYKENTLRIWARAGKLNAVKIGGEWRISEEELERIKKGG